MTIMKGALAGALLVLAGHAAEAATTRFTTTLDFGQEVSPAGATMSPAMASGTLALTEVGPAAMRLSFDLLFDPVLDFRPLVNGASGGHHGGAPHDFIGDPDTAVSLAHIHFAPRGAAGPVVFDLFDPVPESPTSVTFNPDGSTRVMGIWGPADGTAPIWDVAMAMMTAMPGEDTDYYFNIHTLGDPAGAIRGQIVAAADVAPIPLPAAAWMLLAALGLLGVRARRRVA